MPVAVSLAIAGLGPALLGEAEIHHHRAVRPSVLGHEHDVLGLQVAMDDLELVRVVQPGAHLPQDRQPGREIHRAPPHFAVGEQLALEERHHQVDEPVLRLAQAQDAADVGVIEPHRETGLAPQPLHRALVAGQLGRQDLDRDFLVAGDLLGEVDVRHPALAQLLEHLIAGVEQLVGQGRGAVQAGRRLERRRPDRWRWRCLGRRLGRRRGGAPCTSTSMEPSFGQKRASSVYTVSHFGQRRWLTRAPGCGRRPWRGTAPGRPAR